MKIGLLVNPIAGMGGPVGLKGTDHVVEEAIRRGAQPRAHDRAVRFLRALRNPDALDFATAAGAMGEDALEKADLPATIVYAASAAHTTGADTKAAARALREAGAQLLVVVGGDGTAADVAAAVGASVPVVGIPSGSKMYSAVFAETPESAAALVESRFDATAEREVLDIDEDAFRQGELRVRLKGVLSVPAHAAVQAGKLAGEDDAVEQESLAQAVLSELHAGVTYVLGAGTTMYALKEAMGIVGTLLGVDAVRLDEGGAWEVVARDATERDLLALTDPVSVIVSPIGRQGFFLGRGNTQLSPAVLHKAGAPDGVTVMATPSKLLETQALHADTGDPALDRAFPAWIRVTTGHGQVKLMRYARA